ncbi:small RNA-binding protein 11, chloroplastic-like isoform X2 [Aristolochia californica]|uniref:small RNA-binding protein 11, chloroplastic-like isoform X2 n=1 Tax=Aristolochia californica TaxID=171875 RepID=UPI0035DA9BFC
MGSLFGRKAARNCSQLLFSRSFSSQLFVSRLSFYTTEEELGKAFSPFGKVIEARLVQDFKAKRHKGFGFVTFESEIDAQKALKAMNNREMCSSQAWYHCDLSEQED